jgi:hypothetical protein
MHDPEPVWVGAEVVEVVLAGVVGEEAEVVGSAVAVDAVGLLEVALVLWPLEPQAPIRTESETRVTTRADDADRGDSDASGPLAIALF